MYEKELVDYILEENIVEERTVRQLLDQQKATGQSLVKIIRKNNLLDDEQVARLVAMANDIEFVELTPDMVDPMVAHMITKEMALQYNVIPVSKNDNELLVAMSSPLNLAARDQIETRTGCRVIPLAASNAAVGAAVRFHFDVQNATRQTIASMRLKADGAGDGATGSRFKNKSREVVNAPVTRLVSSIITGAIDARASDIHIEPQEPDIRVRYRIDGILRDALDVPSSAQQEVISHIKILADMDIAEKRVPQDGHITMEHDGCEYDLRLSSLPTVAGEKIVIRVLEKSAGKWVLDNVVTSPGDNAQFKAMLGHPNGLFLLTGPTGSGKTTTLYSALQLLNTPEKNIITIEDPVEYCLEGVNQIQVNRQSGLVFASALRTVLRQDPDVVFVGEIRDLETAEIAVSAALTGHLVLSTLHTNDATGAVGRLINLGVQPFLVASALLGSVAQRLVRTCCPKCSQSNTISPERFEQITGMPIPHEITLTRGGGCSACYHTGYQGRKAIYEIFEINDGLKKMIAEGQAEQNIRQEAIAGGMRTLRDSGLQEVVDGYTTPEELRRIVDLRIRSCAGVRV